MDQVASLVEPMKLALQRKSVLFTSDVAVCLFSILHAWTAHPSFLGGNTVTTAPVAKATNSSIWKPDKLQLLNEVSGIVVEVNVEVSLSFTRLYWGNTE